MDAYDVATLSHSYVKSVESHLSSPFGLGSGNNTAQGPYSSVAA